MALIVLRSVKGSPLTIEEADANFSNLNTEVGQKLDYATYTPSDILSKLLTVDGDGSGLDADTLDGFHGESANIVSTIVLRDENGDFSSRIISAEEKFVGSLEGNVVGNVTGNVTGNATNITGTLSIGNGGTGATGATAARSNLGLGSIATQEASSVAITGGTITGITDLAIADGGTGASTAAGARTNLGLVLGSDVQPFANNLTAVSSLSTNGIYVRTGTATAAIRTIEAGTNIGSITNADGAAGNFRINGSTTPTVTNIIKSGTNGSGNIGQSDNRFGTIYGTATSAVYADLAEKYLADGEYAVGTVMMVGGEAEVTASKWGYRPIGVISENPAFKMNDGLDGGTFIALKGRVPVRVIGSVRKGDKIVAADSGLGASGVHNAVDYFGISLEDSDDTGIKLVECVIL